MVTYEVKNNHLLTYESKAIDRSRPPIEIAS